MPNLKIVANLLIAITLFYGTAMGKRDKGVLLKINDKPISTEEFVRIYEKNNKNLFDESKKLTPKEYLELFVNFKLKVEEAQALGLDTVKTFLDELNGYRKDLASTYLTDISFNEKMVEEMYRRKTLEVNASHILIRLDKNATGKDTLDAYNKINAIRNRIVEGGANFEKLAFENSEDPSAKSNKGKLGYFSAFQMVYPFEEAAFTTPIGEISKPVRTDYGYHILRVNSIRPAKGQIKCAHIMKSFPENSTTEQRNKLKNTIDSVHALLENGRDFAELAKQFSDDKRSAKNGGEIPWFSTSNMIASFSEAAFALEKDGDFTDAVVTSYGYHIIKRLDYKPIPPFEEVKGEIEQKIRKDADRSNRNKAAFIAKMKKEYQFQENKENMKSFYQQIGSSANMEDLKNEGPIGLFMLDSVSYTSDSFQKYIESHQLQLSNISESVFKQIFKSWAETEITNYEDSKLEEKYPDFKYLLKEYHDGILLFNLSEQKIWNFAATDTTGLEAHYNVNKDKYFWGDRFKGLIITCKNQETRDKVDSYFESNVPVQEILDIINTDDQLVTIEDGAWEQGANPIVDYYVWEMEKPKNIDENLVYIRGDKVGSEAKTLNEARGMYISDYQNHLEKKWVEVLRDKYKVKVYKSVLKKIKEV